MLSLPRLDIFGTAIAANTLNDVVPVDSFWSLRYLFYIAAIGALAIWAVVAAARKRRQTEKALHSEKVFADTIIDSVPGAFFVLDSDGRLVRWNHFLEELNELPSEELTHMDSLRNIHTEDRQLIFGKIQEAFERGHSEAEGRIYTKTGLRYFFFTGRRVYVENAAFVVGSGIDVTDRKIAELQLIEHQRDLEGVIERRTAELTEANAALAAEIRESRAIEASLAESERKYRDLVEGANSVILRWTNEGKITFINRFAKEFFGYSEEEILGRNIIGTIVPTTESSGRDLSSLVQDIFEKPEAFVLNENENIRKNGDRVWISWTNKAIPDSLGNVVEILSVGNDITGHKLAEVRLKNTLEELALAKERAEAADHLKSAFLATMSHELRTPLNSIIGFTGIMLKGYVGPLNDEQAKQLSMVQNSANHLLSLINDVLDISKIEAGQLQVSSDPFSLPAAIERSVHLIRPAAEKKGLSLVVRVSPDIDTIISDQRRVEQILLNLLSNAVKFTEKGEVRVECTAETEGWLTVQVSDTGIGIKEADMGKIFKAFQQVDSGTTRKYEGTGLGLYICQKLVKLLEGRIWVTSQPGIGTTFSFTLPQARRGS